jgi:hypothetical protein
MMLRLAFGICLLSAPAHAQDALFFHSPSGNIQCMIATGDWAVARCDMSDLTRSFTKAPADCQFDFGSSFEVEPSARKGLVGCISDTVANPDGLVLDYGKSISLGGFLCTSEKSGMTCTNPAGHGFTIAKAKQTVF